MGRDNDYATGNLWNYEYFSKHEERALMLLNIEKSEKQTFNFSQNAATVVWFWPRLRMETQIIANLLRNADSKSSKRKWYGINPQNNTRYGEGNEDSATVKFKTRVIKSNLCDYSDTYILVIGNITATGGGANTSAAFKNFAPFSKCATHINEQDVFNADNVEIIMPMYHLIKYSDNYEENSGSLWQFKRDEYNTTNGNPANVTTDDSTSFKCKLFFLNL